MTTNAYGLDVDYFRCKLERLQRDLDRYTPDEFARECARMSRTADDQVLQEPEFAPLQLWHCLACRGEWPTDRACDVCEAPGVPGALPEVCHGDPC